MTTSLGTVELEDAVIRLLQDAMSSANSTNGSDNNGNSGSGSMSNPGSGGGRQAYEFFAFLLWYLLLVLCCLIPTCCAYRRRRQLEARLSEQQDNYDNLQQQNLVFLNNLTQRQNANEALWQEHRCQLVAKAIEDTTMVGFAICMTGDYSLEFCERACRYVAILPTGLLDTHLFLMLHLV